MAKKHQYAVTYHWESLASNRVESGPIKLCLPETLEYAEYVSESLHIDLQATVTLRAE